MASAGREVTAQRKDGSTFPIDLAASKVDRFQMFIGFIRDISERKRSAESLYESEQRLRSTLQGARGGVWDWDLEQDTAWWSNEMYELWGIRRGTPMHLANSMERVFEQDRETLRQAFDDAIARGSEYHCEFRILHPDRGERWMVSHGQVRFGSDGRAVRMLGITLDITERKLSEERLRQSDRLSAIGTLAAGLGHDMHNVLLPLRSRLDLLDRSDVAPPLQAQFKEIRKSAKYLQELADGLHLLALDPDDPEASNATTQLGEWWSHVHTLLGRALPKHVQFAASMPDDLPAIRVAPHRLTQAILNLLVNSAKAVGANGKVRLWAEADPERDMIRLCVADNGCGMTDEVKRRAFEPFFTTKTRGLGTGLGLSLVHGVVRSAGGSIDVDSAPGKGTTIVLNFPTVASSPARAEDGSETRKAWSCAHVSIADKRIESLVINVLEASGFQVTCGAPAAPAAGGLWATEAASADAERIRAFVAEHGRVIIVGSTALQVDAPAVRIVADPNDFGALQAVIGSLADGDAAS